MMSRAKLEVTLYGPERDGWTAGAFVSWEGRGHERTVTVHLLAWQLVVELVRWPRR